MKLSRGPAPDGPRAPDLTERVMRRLGLPAVTPREATRRRRRRALLRAALCVVFAAAGGLAVMLLWSQPGPSAPTIPAAIRHDLQEHGRTIDRTIRSIRGLGGQLPAVETPAPQPREESGKAPAEPSV